MCGMTPPSRRSLVVIQTDPTKSHRAVEGLRIALGLGSHSDGHDITIILCGRAPHLLADDTGAIIDAEILEKHLPVFTEWGTPFFIAPDADLPHSFFPGVVTKPITLTEIAAA